jgi:peptidoglycan/xylan/chitin deacetylase (PgdA/CDA1 family)
MTQPAQITTSWDDGSPDDLRIAELLDQYGLPGTFYVPKSAQRAVIGDAQVRRLAEVFDVGAHTMHHTVLPSISDKKALEEIAGSKKWIEDVVGRECPLFCFPRGKFRRRHLGMVRRAGFRAARTVEMMSVAGPRSLDDLRLLPTTIQAFPQPGRVYLVNSLKRRRWQNVAHLFRAGWTKDWVSQIEQLLQYVAEEGGVFHLWGHSWEIAKHDLWEELEHAFALMSRYEDQVALVTNAELCSPPGSM